MNILISTNSAFVPPARVMLYSLFSAHKDTAMDVYMPYSSLSDDEVTSLLEFTASFPNKTLHPILIPSDFSEKVVSHNGISIETYYRILAIDLLPKELSRILYLDVDMVIQGSLEELYNTDFQGCPFVVCEDILGILNNFHEMNKIRMAIPKEYSYFNAGVMLFNLELLRKEQASEKIIKRILENFEKYEYNDQDVLNEMYFDRLKWADWSLYNLPPALYYLDLQALSENKVVFADYEIIRNAPSDPEGFQKRYNNVTVSLRDNARIIHYMGAAKPWKKDRQDSVTYQIFDPVYQRFADKVLKSATA